MVCEGGREGGRERGEGREGETEVAKFCHACTSQLGSSIHLHVHVHVCILFESTILSTFEVYLCVYMVLASSCGEEDMVCQKSWLCTASETCVGPILSSLSLISVYM